MKIMATVAVNFPKKVPAPEEPKTVWLEPPKAAPILAPLPACSSTTKIRTKQAKTCKNVTNAFIKFSSLKNVLLLKNQFKPAFADPSCTLFTSFRGINFPKFSA
jgi:hypothetical protein